MTALRLLRMVLIGVAALAAPVAAGWSPAAARSSGGSTGLQLPRFVSLKSDRVPVRQGPGTDYKILWLFRRVGLPVEVLQEYEGWRQIRDSEGATGWVIQTLLSARRTALVVPWRAPRGHKGKASSAKTVSLLAARKPDGGAIAALEPGVIVSVRGCDGTWCDVVIGDYRGFVPQRDLWGVYPGEPLP